MIDIVFLIRMSCWNTVSLCRLLPTLVLQVSFLPSFTWNGASQRFLVQTTHPVDEASPHLDGDGLPLGGGSDDEREAAPGEVQQQRDDGARHLRRRRERARERRVQTLIRHPVVVAFLQEMK